MLVINSQVVLTHAASPESILGEPLLPGGLGMRDITLSFQTVHIGMLTVLFS